MGVRPADLVPDATVTLTAKVVVDPEFYGRVVNVEFSPGMRARVPFASILAVKAPVYEPKVGDTVTWGSTGIGNHIVIAVDSGTVWIRDVSTGENRLRVIDSLDSLRRAA